jgi:hypothetical protein
MFSACTIIKNMHGTICFLHGILFPSKEWHYCKILVLTPVKNCRQKNLSFPPLVRQLSYISEQLPYTVACENVHQNISYQI